MKQTAVEWLVQELHDNGYFHEGVPEDIVNKAKEMEKEQIVDAYEQGIEDGYWHPENGYTNRFKDAEDYYNETFKSE